MRYIDENVKLSSNKILNLTFIDYGNYKELVKSQIVTDAKLTDSSLRFVINEWSYYLYYFREDCFIYA